MRVLLASLLLLFPLNVFALDVPPAPSDAVLDQAELLSEAFEQELVAQIEAVETETTAEVAVLTIESLEGEVLEWYALEVLRGWGIGQEEMNNGILLLIAEQDRKMRIEVGYGLEGIITDAGASYIINEIMTPEFKAGNFEEGVRQAVQAIEVEIKNDYGSLAAEPPKTHAEQMTQEIIVIALAEFTWFIILAVFIGSMASKKRKKWQRRPLMAVLGSFFSITLASTSGAIFAGILGAFALNHILRLIDFSGSGGKGGKGKKTFWSSVGAAINSKGGVSGGSSGYSGGGSFGGGSGGGGGASGSW